MAIPIDLASAKIRTGPPGDDEEDMALPVWAGVLPIEQQFLSPESAPDMDDNIRLPQYISDYLNRKHSND